jgi:hypothetical protein
MCASNHDSRYAAVARNIFIVPVGRNADGYEYEAVFT